MGKANGFLEVPRIENAWRSVPDRLRDYDGMHESLTADNRRCQASRCMDCGVPFCQSDYGCPLHNLIPEWNDLLYRGQEQEALMRLLLTAPFPEFTGRVCPALCEKACNLANDGVTNRDNELYLMETGFSRGWVRPRIPYCRTGKRAAVIGSGPAGLAAADALNQAGHSVEVFERADLPGGLLMYGIPNMKLPKEVVMRRVHLMEEEGVRFRTGTEAAPEMMVDMDAVIFCGGARKPRPLAVEHAAAEGVMYAVDFLTEATRALLTGEVCASAQGRHVVVVGGGDTGNDCVATALRQGCTSVRQLEMMPEPPGERAPGNPWPQWPRILRTDYGQVEAMYVQGADPRIYETTVSRIRTGADGRVCAVECVRLDRDHRSVPGSEQEMPCDLLLIAAGFVGCESGTLDAFGLKADARGRLMPQDGSYNLGGKWFSAGDMRTGQSLVVRALADGRACAREVDAFLKQKNAF